MIYIGTCSWTKIKKIFTNYIDQKDSSAIFFKHINSSKQRKTTPHNFNARLEQSNTTHYMVVPSKKCNNLGYVWYTMDNI